MRKHGKHGNKMTFTDSKRIGGRGSRREAGSQISRFSGSSWCEQLAYLSNRNNADMTVSLRTTGHELGYIRCP